MSILSLCVCVFKNGHRLTLKSLFTHPATHPPTRKLFLVSNERYGQNKTFLLQCYGIDFAPIKRYHPFCFLWLYFRRQRLSLYDIIDIYQLSVCLFFFLFVCLLFFGWLFFFFLPIFYFPICCFSFCVTCFFLFVCLSFFFSVCLFFFFKFFSNFHLEE